MIVVLCWQKIISSQKADEASLLRFQAALLSSLSLALTTTISPEDQPLLDALQFALQADEQKEEGNHTDDWRAIGFSTNDPGSEFEETGLLGLKLMARMARDHTKAFQSVSCFDTVPAIVLLLISCPIQPGNDITFSTCLSPTSRIIDMRDPSRSAFWLFSFPCFQSAIQTST